MIKTTKPPTSIRITDASWKNVRAGGDVRRRLNASIRMIWLGRRWLACPS